MKKKNINVKEKINKLIRFLIDWRTAISFGIAWMITNGWSYVCLGIGIALNIKWMIAIGTAYLTFLWLPFTPEKLVTIPIAVFIKKIFFKKGNKIMKNKVKGCLVLSNEELQIIENALNIYYWDWVADNKKGEPIKNLQEKIKEHIEKEK